MDEIQYHIDGEGVSAWQLINAASAIDDDFAGDHIKSTSQAARILRDAGHAVGNFTEAREA